MIILEVMSALKAQLLESLPGSVVEYCPPRPGDYLRQPGDGSAQTGGDSVSAEPPVILLRYCGCRYSEPGGSMNALVQNGQFRFEALLLVDELDADLYGLVGAIELLDRIRGSLLGFKPPHSGRVHLKRECFEEDPAGDFQYRLEFLVDGTIVQIKDSYDEKVQL